MRGFDAILAAAFLGDPLGGGGAMMAVGDVERGQGIDGAGQRRDRRVVADHPELMAHAVVGGDVDRGLAGGGARQQWHRSPARSG